MFINTIASEAIKLFTTRSIWWTSILFILSSVGMAALMGRFTEGMPLTPENVTIGVFMFGFLILAVQAVMVVTSEYRHKYQSVTYLATPRRWLVAVAKLLLYAVIAMVLTFVVVVLCYLVAGWMTSGDTAAAYDPFGSESGQRMLWTSPLQAGMLVLFSQGIGLLLRQTAGAVTLVLVWYLALEDLIGMLPKVGTDVRNYLPFTNLNAFVSNSPVADLPWGVVGSALYYLLWAAVIWIAGVVLLQKRDA